MTSQATFALIEECRAALAEELSAWDIDPPLHHVKQAHDKCEAWLEAYGAAPQAEPSEPVQAQPVPLSEERINMFWRGAIIRNDTTAAQMIDFAKSIEAAHGIGAKTGGA